MQEQDEANTTFFLFINAGSGGNLGRQMLEDEVQKYEFRLPIMNIQDIRRIDVYIYNMRQNREKGFKKLKEMNSNKKRTAAVVCGGDGTIMWVVSEFKKYDINPAFTPLAIIPLGTGNDFSRSLGWGGSPFLKWNPQTLKQLIRNWMEAQESEFDLWDVYIKVYENGRFQKVSDQKDVILQQKVLKKTFCNYFSFGVDGQIGYSFDKLRTKNKFANLAVYGAVGALNQLQKPMLMNQLVETLCETPTPFDDENYKNKSNLIFRSVDNKLHLYGSKGTQTTINSGQRNILALNIDSYTGGTTGIWKNSQAVMPFQQTYSTSYSDGLIQVVSFDSGLSIAMEKSFGGFAKRITQSGGPLRYDFKRVDLDKHCTYLQIDGEFMRVYHPKTVVIQKSDLVPGGKIRILRRDIKKNIFNPFKDIQQLFL